MEPRLWNGLWNLGYGRIVYGTWVQKSYIIHSLGREHEFDQNLEIAFSVKAIAVITGLWQPSVHSDVAF